MELGACGYRGFAAKRREERERERERGKPVLMGNGVAAVGFRETQDLII